MLVEDARPKPEVGDGDCLLWQGALNENGYGYIKLKGKQVLVHRFVALYYMDRSVEQLVRLDRPKMYVKQTCGLRLCINPRHLKFEAGKQYKTWEPLTIDYSKLVYE